MASRQEVVERIKALRAKAEDAAASEAEAMAAAEMAARLLVKHDIQPDEMSEVEKSEGVVQGTRHGKVLHPVADYTANPVARFTETRAYTTGGEIRFIGLEEDVLMAVYLIEMMVGAAKRGWLTFSEKNYGRLKYKTMMERRFSYFFGFASRMSQRLSELTELREASRHASQGQSNSNALVVVKSEIIKRKMEEMGLVIGERRPDEVRIDHKAFVAGSHMGGIINLERPLHQHNENHKELT